MFKITPIKRQLPWVATTANFYSLVSRQFNIVRKYKSKSNEMDVFLEHISAFKLFQALLLPFLVLTELIFFPAVDICKKCDINAKCINDTCVCVEGYYGDGFTCRSK